MIPIRSTIRTASFPIVTWFLVGINAAVFVYEIRLGKVPQRTFILNYGLIPASLSFKEPNSLLPVFTAMFLHSGWFHFLGNMWTLLIFGGNVEDRIGRGKYLFIYLLGGLGANLLHAWIFADSFVPTIGASGAIAVVLGAYFRMYPTARVLTLVPVGFFMPWFIHVPAFFYLGFWFLLQLLSGVSSLSLASAGSTGGVAWWAHIGGFVIGILFAQLFIYRQIEVEEEEVESEMPAPQPQPPHLPEDWVDWTDWEEESDWTE